MIAETVTIVLPVLTTNLPFDIFLQFKFASFTVNKSSGAALFLFPKKALDTTNSRFAQTNGGIFVDDTR